MSQAVIKTTMQQINKMMESYSSFVESKKPPASIFVAKPPGCTVTAYKSGKVLFQGREAEAEAKKWGQTKQKETKSNSKPKSEQRYRPPATIQTLSIVGSDEVGTGDYFGPMTVVAAFVSKEQIDELQSLGVKDSKNLTDRQIVAIAKKIIPVVPHSLLVLHNEKYNEIQEKGYTQGKIKAMLHNQAINHVLKKIDKSSVDGVLIDQFVVPDTYFKHIKGKTYDWTGPTYFSTKAEGVHIAVAAASIIARQAFIKEFDKLSEKAGITLQKGAGAQVDEIAAQLIRKNGEDSLRQFTKVHFANTEKAKKLL
jgi:ribonuclease HIII